MSQPFKLYRLQQIDSQLDRARARIQAIETALSENEALRQAQAKLSEAEANLRNAQKALRKAEENVREQRLKIEQTEATLYGGRVRNPKELQDMQNEAAALKRYHGVLEDRQLEAMLALEEAETAQALAANEFREVRAAFEQAHAELAGERNSLQREAARLEEERQAAAGSIPSEDLELYNLLRIQRNGVAVARVDNRACSACGTTLSSALLSTARSPNQITRCATCGRILYAL